VNNSKLTAAPKLAKPGAGLPFVEWAIAKYILLPGLFRETGNTQAIDHFVRESEKIAALSSELNSEMLTEQRLIPRHRGLEDSSRYWSVAMALEHLVIVGDMMRQVVVDLSSGGTNMRQIGIADVKPGLNVDPAEALQTFEEMTERFVRETTAANIDAFPTATYPHPWFGPLNAHQWLTFAAPHERIHRKQIEAIIARL